MDSNQWHKLDTKLNTGRYDARTVTNPFTNEMYLVGGYWKDSIQIERFDPRTDTILPQPFGFGDYFGGSSVEIFNDLILSIGGYNTLTNEGPFNVIRYAFLPQIPSLDRGLD